VTTVSQGSGNDTKIITLLSKPLAENNICSMSLAPPISTALSWKMNIPVQRSTVSKKGKCSCSSVLLLAIWRQQSV